MNATTYTAEMTHHYLVAALWTGLDWTDDDDGNAPPLDQSYTLDDLTIAARETAEEDCARFVEMAGDLLDGIPAEMAGHDFSLTRNHHGAGFWDRGYGHVGDRLTEIADTFGMIDLLPTGDGGIEFS